MPLNNPYYCAAVHGDYDLVPLGRFELEGGGVIPDLRLAVATYGTLAPDASNAVLVPTWFGGTHSTWWQLYIGPGRALDPQRYFIVVANQIGNGLSTSPHTVADPAIAMSRFPHVRIGDDVRAQQRLLAQAYGIERLALVVGASMGAQQVWEWAVRFPDRVARAAPIAGTARTGAHCAFIAEALIDAITSDPGFADGEYARHTDVAAGLRRHADLWTVLGLSSEFWATQAWRRTEWPGASWTSPREFRDDFLRALFAMCDPNALVAMARKWRDADVARHTGGDLEAALARVTAAVCAMPIDEDLLFPVRDMAAEQCLVPGSRLRVLHSLAGHLALFGFERSVITDVDRALRELLAVR